MVITNLICVFVFAYANCWFSHEAAHLLDLGLQNVRNDKGRYYVYDSSNGKNKNWLVNEPPRGKTNIVVSEQVRHKLACTSTEES